MLEDYKLWFCEIVESFKKLMCCLGLRSQNLFPYIFHTLGTMIVFFAIPWLWFGRGSRGPILPQSTSSAASVQIHPVTQLLCLSLVYLCQALT